MANGRIQNRKEAEAPSVSLGASTLDRGGKIKVGTTVPAKTKEGKDYNRPTSIDYFRATGKFAETFHKIVGPNPKQITIVFISNNIPDVCNELYKCWDDGKLWGWGDGVDFVVFDESKKKRVNCKAGDPLLSGKKWDEYLTLKFVIPAIKGVVCEWVFETKGKLTSIPSIRQSFDFIHSRMASIVGIPFILSVEKVKGYSPGEAKNYPIVSLTPAITEEAMDLVNNYLSIPGNQLSKIAPLMLTDEKMKLLK